MIKVKGHQKGSLEAQGNEAADSAAKTVEGYTYTPPGGGGGEDTVLVQAKDVTLPALTLDVVLAAQQSAAPQEALLWEHPRDQWESGGSPMAVWCFQ